MKRDLLLVFFVLFAVACNASVIKQLETLEVAVEQAVARLDYDVGSDFDDSRDFSVKIPMYVEIALIQLGAQDLFAEDFYNLSLYMICRRAGKFNEAIKFLQAERKEAKHRPIIRWLNKRIEHLQKLLVHEKGALSIERGFSINKEFADLKAVLKRNGMR